MGSNIYSQGIWKTREKNHGVLFQSSPKCSMGLETQKFHQKFQVPKMEVLNLISGHFGGAFYLTWAVSIQLI